MVYAIWICSMICWKKTRLNNLVTLGCLNHSRLPKLVEGSIQFLLYLLCVCFKIYYCFGLLYSFASVIFNFFLCLSIFTFMCFWYSLYYDYIFTNFNIVKPRVERLCAWVSDMLQWANHDHRFQLTHSLV